MYAGRFTLTPTAWDAFDRLIHAYDIPAHNVPSKKELGR